VPRKEERSELLMALDIKTFAFSVFIDVYEELAVFNVLLNRAS
jgi:hypothetical protein